VSRPVDIAKFGAIYGGAQKNAGSAGLTLVIVRKELFGHALSITPSAFNWKEQSESDSMLNTPPTYAIYIAGLVFEWLQSPLRVNVRIDASRPDGPGGPDSRPDGTGGPEPRPEGTGGPASRPDGTGGDVPG